jgi:hypothetical protein
MKKIDEDEIHWLLQESEREFVDVLYNCLRTDRNVPPGAQYQIIDLSMMVDDVFTFKDLS